MVPAEHSTAPLVEVGLTDRRIGMAAFLIIFARAAAVLGITLLLYALMPVESASSAAWIVAVCGAGLVLVIGVFFRQFSRIEQADRPGAAAIEALVLVVGLFLTLFALIYVTISSSDPESFTLPLDKVAGIYFSVTILTTVGYGDIAPVTDGTRILVTIQMLLDIALIGAAVKLLGMKARAVQEQRHRPRPHSGGDPEGTQPARPLSGHHEHSEGPAPQDGTR